MSLLVHSDQTCGVPGRSATWNRLLIRDAISWAGDRNVPLALVSLDQEKVFDRVDHSFLERVLMTLGFGPNFLRWLKTFYTEVGSRVSINGHLSDLVPQESGVRQGCPLSPLLYALYIEPLATAIRAHPGIDGLPISGGGGKVVKLAQYADNTTLFVRSDQSLRLALDMVQAFGNASGAALNLGKSVVKYFGRWTVRRGAGPQRRCPEDPGGFLYARRGCPSKLGTKVGQHCARLAAPLEHPHQSFVRLWLSWPLRSILSTWSNSGPKAETLPDHYQHLVRWSKLLPAGLRPEAFVRHRTLYKEVLDGRGYRAVVGLEEDTWSRVQPKGLDKRLQDLNWQCVHGSIMQRRKGGGTLRSCKIPPDSVFWRGSIRGFCEPFLNFKILW
ncbi:hypothetical protein SRHO_G00186980 [Serrasalmus rhombeus]